ncbi:MAG: T9SS type A sorting domain-containing protein [Saprospiraceae bacterium]|nr:T9SS type A sorting domain-containing protein [Saprospiraceae bacterium]
MKKLLPIIAMFLAVSTTFAQVRYLDETFTSVKVTNDVTYGVNATILLLGSAGQAVPQPLQMDIYEPEGDTETARPVVIMFHTGNFLPPQVNGGCTGTRKDADLVEMAQRLARMGYVAVCASYRLGWDPVNTNPDVRVYTLINAAYRGVQDSRTAIRFFKKSVAENNNPYGIDPNKIALWGNGTGGYITFASNTLDTITDTWIPGKFVTAAGPMVIEQFNGNVQGTTVGVIPPTGVPGLPFPPNDTLCYPNHVGYTDNFQLSVSIGGALGDSSWIDPSDPPMIGMQVTTDPFAPYENGIVLVPPPVNLPVVDVSGSGVAVPIAFSEGVQGPIDHPFIDPVSMQAMSASGGIPGLYPFFSSDPTEGSPWNYAGSLNPYNLMTSPNCDTNSVGAKVFIDTIMHYFAPRACLALDLGCNLDGYSATNDVLDAAQVGLLISPNPASEFVRFKTETEFPIEHIYVYDATGRLVKAHTNVDSNQFTMQRNSLVPGNYFAKVMFKNGFVTKQVMFN